jgi:hypothetical protein
MAQALQKKARSPGSVLGGWLNESRLRGHERGWVTATANAVVKPFFTGVAL